MSVASDAIATPPAPDKGRRKVTTPIVLLGIAAVLLALSLLRVITGADEIASSGTISATIAAAIPIGLAGLGGLWAERAGIVNIGLEGMMILGTFGAGYFGYFYDPWQGVIGAIVLGAIGGLIHATATVIFNVNHIVSGVAINIIALGAVQYLAEQAFSGVEGGGQSQSPPIDSLPSISIDALSDPLQDFEDKHLFLLSDAAAFVRALVTNMSVLTLIALGLFVLTWWILWRTSFGLRLRSCGESPQAAESLGVNVYYYKFIAVLVSGGLAGLGGGFLALVASSTFRDGQTGGRGYIGLASMIFGNWRPGGLLTGAGLFGYTDSIQYRDGETSVHALLLLIAIVMIGIAYWQWIQADRVMAVVAAVLGVGAAVWFFASDVVPSDFTSMTPYVTTLLVLALASQRLRMPMADGLPYRKGSAG